MKPYKNNDYIKDIYDLCKAEFSEESIIKANEICKRLLEPITHYRLRWLSRWLWIMTCALCFISGMNIDSIGV